MDLQKAYHAANDILRSIDFQALFAGFHPYKFALYNSREICLDGKMMPYQADFRGNSSLEYQGEVIAIWNLEFDPIDDPEQLAYCLAHEMFHCHQCANKEARYPSDFELLNYPDDIENYLRKYNENRDLADACEKRDIARFRQFASLRAKRLKAHPESVVQEFKAETIEGLAEYVGLKALRQINAEKYQAKIRHSLDRLREESALLFDVRRLSYDSGAIYFLCLEMFGFPLHNAFDSEQTAYEQNPLDFLDSEAEVRPYEFVARSFRQRMKEQRDEVAAFLSKATLIDGCAKICGYDPMNMFRVDNYIYCRHFVYLDRGGKILDLNSAVVLKLAEGATQEIVGYYTLHDGNAAK